MKRRNLSGIYVFDKFEDEEEKQPTCFEDCQKQTQDEWLKALDRDALINLSKQLGNALRTIGDQLDLFHK